MHVPTAHNAKLQERHKVGVFVFQKQVSRRFVQQPKVAVALTQSVVQVQIFVGRKDAEPFHPQQALMSWFQ